MTSQRSREEREARRNRWLRIGVAISVAVLIGVGNHPGSADQYTDQIAADQSKLNSNNQSIAAIKAQLAQVQDQAAALQKIVDTINDNISTTNDEISVANTKLDSINAALAKAQADLASTEATMAGDKEQLRTVMVFLYKAHNQSSNLNNLFSGDFNSFWQQVIGLDHVTQAEHRLVDDVQRDEDAITAEVAQISDEQAQQKATLAQLQSTRDQLNSELDQRRAAQAQLAALQAQYHQQAEEWQQADQQLQAQIAQLQQEEAAAQAAGGGSGRFSWPMTGSITQGFGCTPYTFEPYDPNCSTRHFHSGIDIANACNTPIRAGDAGIAHTYVTNYGYGHYIIIVHGNGWTSLYGHMYGFNVGDGQTVGRGQVIGWEGSTGNSTGCHLHFEVRLNGNPQNPLQYLS